MDIMVGATKENIMMVTGGQYPRDCHRPEAEGWYNIGSSALQAPPPHAQPAGCAPESRNRMQESSAESPLGFSPFCASSSVFSSSYSPPSITYHRSLHPMPGANIRSVADDLIIVPEHVFVNIFSAKIEQKFAFLSNIC